MKEKEHFYRFSETFDKSNILISTFENNNKKLNFIIDTGSNLSHIDASCLKYIDCKCLKTDETNIVYGLGDIAMTVNNIYNISLTFNDDMFNEDFLISNMSESSKQFKEKFGIELHGLLGTPFLIKYNYIINFKDKTFSYKIFK